MLPRSTRLWRAPNSIAEVVCAMRAQAAPPTYPHTAGACWRAAAQGYSRSWRASCRKSRSQLRMAQTGVESLCVEPIAHQASDRQRAEAQDVGHPHDDSKVLLPSGASAGALRAVQSIPVGPVKHPGAQAPDLSQAACPMTALCSTGGTCRGTSGARWGRGLCGVLPCCRWARLQREQRLGWLERLERHRGVLTQAISSCVSGRAAVSPGRHQLAAVGGHRAEAHGGGVCDSAEHVPSAAACWPADRFRTSVWRPTQTNRQGNGGPLKPPVIERGRYQIN